MTKENRLFVREFGVIGNENVFLYRIRNGEITIELTNYGCTIVSIYTPDKWGHSKNIVAGFNHLSQYTQDHPYIGCVIGRYANRIAHGKFSIDGVSYQLPVNDGKNHLHGGVQGFGRKIWKLENTIEEPDQVGVVFSYKSEDGEEGYPGNLTTTVTYLLNKTNSLSIRYKATTDQPTIISLTNHSYFNLTGFEVDVIYNHCLQINAASYLKKNENNTPTGVIVPTDNTPLDFSAPQKIGKHIDQLQEDMGYDHNFVLKNDHHQVSFAAHLFEEKSGRSLKVYTNQPGLQVYTANWWDGQLTGSQNKPYCKHGAIALETQAFPDAANHPNFPPVILRPGVEYDKETVFQF